VVTVAAFIIVGLLLDAGVVGNPGEAIWFSNYAHGITDFYGLLAVILTAGFSFQGAELVGIAAGESKNPQRNVPYAIGQVYWRTLLFYLFTIMVVGLLIPYNHPNLIDSGADALAISPFTIVFKETGLGASMHIINFVILTTVLSAGNSGVYAASRALYNMACEGCAPKIFGQVSEKGVPFYAVFATASVASYSGAPLFLTLFFTFKIFKRTKVVPLMECDFDRGFDPNAVDIDEDQFDILTKMTAVMIKGGNKIRNVDFLGNVIGITGKGIPGDGIVTEGQVVVDIPHPNVPMPGETPVVPVAA
ncbi:13051_t:CDS:2, partial [Acaulospora colombiana]